jgi:hypothetical protein
MDESLRRHKGLKKTNKIIWRQKIEEENPRLVHDFPTVFDMHMEGKLDETFFYMLQMRQKIEKGELTEDEASKLVGQKLFDRFVGPIVGNTPPPEPTLSYADYYKQFEEKE